jgi:dihydrofolate reductase
MQIRTRLAVSVDGFIAYPNGLPTFLAMPDFEPHSSYGWPEFSAQCQAVILGRVALDAGLANPTWPWPGLDVFVLTSKPLPEAIPAGRVVSDDTPEGLVAKLRGSDLEGDAFLLGGQRTVNAFLELGAIDRLELLEFPVILGEGVPFRPPGSQQVSLELEEHHSFPDGTLHNVYSLKS